MVAGTVARILERIDRHVFNGELDIADLKLIKDEIGGFIASIEEEVWEPDNQ